MCDAPDYLQDLLSVISASTRTLRSANKYKQLVIPKVKRKTFAARSFSIRAPLLWNGLPDSLCRANNVETFKAELKTLLFRRYYMWISLMCLIQLFYYYYYIYIKNFIEYVKHRPKNCMVGAILNE